jgi:hypothetical protein
VRAEVLNRWVIGGVDGVGNPAGGPSADRASLLEQRRELITGICDRSIQPKIDNALGRPGRP